MKLWRICRALHAATGSAAFSGTGGLHVDGRWHTKGQRVVYAAATESLARLEVLAHLRPARARHLRLVLVEATLPDALVASLEGPPPVGWDDLPDSGAGRPVGDAWLASSRSLALAVPSVHSQSETNLLINPLHPEVRRLVVGTPTPLEFDRRLLD